MKDRLKFRVWNKKTKELKNILGFCRSNGFEELINIQYANGSYVGCIPFEDVEIMQCTGLKDKNGKLIFEGDILNILSEIDTVAKTEWDNDLARFIIHYENIQCDFDNYNSYELEVIGNIYKNGDLLKVDEL